MASKPESNMIAHIHKYLPKEIYREKMNNPYRGGTWDVYYEAFKSTMWVEYKYIERLTPLIDLMNLKKSPCLSKLQQDWGTRLHNNRIHNAVILGWGTGRNRKFWAFIDKKWEMPIKREDLEVTHMNTKDLIRWLIQEMK